VAVLVVLPDRERVPVATTAANENDAAFSPDGKWSAYVSDESGRQEVYVQPFPGPGNRVLVSSQGGDRRYGHGAVTSSSIERAPR